MPSKTRAQPEVEHYTGDHVYNTWRPVPWQVYHRVRNSVVGCCRKFGTVGAMLEIDITDDEDPGLGEWPVGDGDPDFFVVDDQYNDWDALVYVEIGYEVPFGEWLRALMRTLRRHRGWGVGINSHVGALRRAYVIAFADRLMV